MKKDSRLYDIADRWGELSWIDRKHICWCRIKATHKINNKLIGSLILVLAIIGIGLFEMHHTHNHTEHLLVAYSIIALLFFYWVAIDELHQTLKNNT